MSEENPEKGPGYVGPNKGPEERQEKDSKKDQLVATAAALCGVISLTVVLHGLDETLVLTGFIVVPLSSMVFVVSGCTCGATAARVKTPSLDPAAVSWGLRPSSFPGPWLSPPLPA